MELKKCNIGITIECKETDTEEVKIIKELIKK